MIADRERGRATERIPRGYPLHDTHERVALSLCADPTLEPRQRVANRFTHLFAQCSRTLERFTIFFFFVYIFIFIIMFTLWQLFISGALLVGISLFCEYP